MIAIHPYFRYAQALLMSENELFNSEQITKEHIALEIEKGLDTFRVQPSKTFEGKKFVEYEFIKAEKGNTTNGVFLAPNVISTD